MLQFQCGCAWATMIRLSGKGDVPAIGKSSILIHFSQDNHLRFSDYCKVGVSSVSVEWIKVSTYPKYTHFITPWISHASQALWQIKLEPRTWHHISRKRPRANAYLMLLFSLHALCFSFTPYPSSDPAMSRGLRDSMTRSPSPCAAREACPSHL